MLKNVPIEDGTYFPTSSTGLADLPSRLISANKDTAAWRAGTFQAMKKESKI